MKGDCSSIYKWVLDDVVAHMAPEFQAANIDESVLQELQSKWEERLRAQGLLRGEGEAEFEDGGQPELKAEEGEEEEEGDGEDDGPGPSGLGKRRREDEGDADARPGPLGIKKEEHEELPPPVNLIPQHDGDPGEEGGGAAAAEEPAPEGDEILSDDDHDEGQEEEEVENLLLGQFDKVNKMKNRWKVMMKDCVFHIRGRDYLFKKATAEFHWQ